METNPIPIFEPSSIRLLPPHPEKSRNLRKAASSSSGEEYRDRRLDTLLHVRRDGNHRIQQGLQAAGQRSRALRHRRNARADAVSRASGRRSVAHAPARLCPWAQCILRDVRELLCRADGATKIGIEHIL